MNISEKDLLRYLKDGVLRYDKKQRPYISVPTHVRRNSMLLVPMKRLNSLIDNGLAEKSDLLKIKSY